LKEGISIKTHKFSYLLCSFASLSLYINTANASYAVNIVCAQKSIPDIQKAQLKKIFKWHNLDLPDPLAFLISYIKDGPHTYTSPSLSALYNDSQHVDVSVKKRALNTWKPAFKMTPNFMTATAIGRDLKIRFNSRHETVYFGKQPEGSWKWNFLIRNLDEPAYEKEDTTAQLEIKKSSNLEVPSSYHFSANDIDSNISINMECKTISTVQISPPEPPDTGG
jgi:hypothetical protein